MKQLGLVAKWNKFMSPIIRILILIASIIGVSLILGGISSIIIPQGFFIAIKQMFGYFGLFNFIIPIATIITLITLTLSFHASLLGYRGVTFIMNYFKPH